jgi:hypothetical protein
LQKSCDEHKNARQVQEVCPYTLNTYLLHSAHEIQARLQATTQEVHYWRSFALTYDRAAFKKFMSTSVPPTSPTHDTGDEAETPARRDGGTASDLDLDLEETSPPHDDLQTPGLDFNALTNENGDEEGDHGKVVNDNTPTRPGKARALVSLEQAKR